MAGKWERGARRAQGYGEQMFNVRRDALRTKIQGSTVGGYGEGSMKVRILGGDTGSG
jgi:hypothetical protein